MEAQRQQAKKRKQRKHDRQKQIEEAHEADKAKWLAFSTKVRFVSLSPLCFLLESTASSSVFSVIFFRKVSPFASTV